jgi:hypothetical protein
MKLQLETIPVWDGIHSNTECFMCDLMKAAEQQISKYYLGSSVMHPETRVAIHEVGFCHQHWNGLLAQGVSQALALIGHTYLQQLRRETERPLNAMIESGKPKATEKAVHIFDEILEHHEQGCLICRDMQQRLYRYADTVVILWKEDDEFRKALSESKGMCLHHHRQVLSRAQKLLRPAPFVQFAADLAQVMELKLIRLEDDVLWMTQKYKAEYADASWNECEDAHKRVVQMLTGDGRIPFES